MPEAERPGATARDALATALRDAVLTGKLPPGARLTELGVAAAYGVARPTARAAIDELTAARLLTHEAHRGASVPVLDEAAIRDLYRARGLLEAGAIRELAARRHVPPDATAALRRIAGAAPGADVEPDLAFHRALVAAAGSPRADLLFAQLADEIRLAIVQCRVANAGQTTLVAEHDAILAGIRVGDGDRAEAALRHHLAEAVRVLTGAPGDQSNTTPSSPERSRASAS